MSRTFGASAILVSLLFLTSACGASPTGPTTTTSSASPTGSSPPGPDTTPASPAPQPTPVPQPPAPDVPAPTVYHATTTDSHWYGEPRLSQTFDVTITGTTVTV